MVDEKQIVMEVVEEISTQLSPYHPTPKPTTELEVELGLGSLERLELVKRLEKRLGRSIEERPIFTARYVSDLLIELSDERAAGPIGIQPRPLPEAPRHCQNLLDTLLYQAEQQPAAAAFAVLEQDREVALPTYAELMMEARKVSAGLRALGVSPGDSVAVMLPTGEEFFSAFFGILNAGAIVVPLYPAARLDQFEDFLGRQDAILENCRAEVLITLPQMAPVAEVMRQRTTLREVTSVKALRQSAPAPLHQAPAEAIAVLQYTSGSTGHPKGVPLTHRNLLVNIWAMGKGFDVRDRDVMVSWLPLYHDMGLIASALMCLAHGIPIVLMAPDQFLGRPARWVQALSNYRGTMSLAPNFAYAIAAKRIEERELEGVDLSHWRLALNGAEPIIPSTVRAFNQRFKAYGLSETTMFPAYGLAEATVGVTFSPLGRGMRVLRLDRDTLARTGEVVEGPDEVPSCGVPIDDIEVRIVDESGVLPEDRQGQLEVRGLSAMSGYYGHAPAPEWLPVGDLGFFHDGELYITGRSKDVIMVGGRNLHPNDVEAVVGQVPGVRAGCVAAIGVEAEGTQRLVVLTETRTSTPELVKQVQAAVQKSTGLAAEVVLLAPRTLPKTPSGKIRRQASKERYLTGKLLAPKLRWASLSKASAAWMKAAPGRVKHWLRGAWCWAWAGHAWVELTLLKRPTGPIVRKLLKRLGVKLRVTGHPFAGGPLMLVANHASLLDGLVLLAAWDGEPLRFVMGKASAQHPLLGSLARSQVLVRRGVGEAGHALQRMTESLEQGACLAVFPEGGIEFSSGLRGFATGPFQACAASGSRLQPVAISGTRQVLPQGQWVANPGEVEVKFLDVIQGEPGDFQKAAALSREARAAIAENLPEQCWEIRLSRRD